MIKSMKLLGLSIVTIIAMTACSSKSDNTYSEENDSTYTEENDSTYTEENDSTDSEENDSTDSEENDSTDSEENDSTDSEENDNTLGELDTSFNSIGFVVHGNAAGGFDYDQGESVVIDTDGKIVVAGHSDNTTNKDMAIWRYNSDGTLDTTFNTNGYVVYDSGNDDYGYAVTIDAVGKIVVTGFTRNLTNNDNNEDMVIWRYNNDGSPDTTFDTDGYTEYDSTTPSPSPEIKDDRGRSVTIDADGKIVVAGSSINSNGDHEDMVIWRYNNDGSPDTTFDTDGHSIYDSTRRDEGLSVAIDTNNKIVVSGFSTNGRGDDDMVLWRYNSDGTIDSTFNSEGFTSHDNAAGGSGDEEGASVTIDADGKIIVAGVSENSDGDDEMAIWRYNSDGTIDTSFNAVGYVVHDGAAGGSDYDEGESVAIDSDGKIVVAGASRTSDGTDDMVLWRYNSDGTIDTSFNGVGYVTHDNAAGGLDDDYGYSIAIDDDNKIVVTGESKNSDGDYDMVIWRYR